MNDQTITTNEARFSATIAYFEGHGSFTSVIRDCYADSDFSAIEDALRTLCPHGKPVPALSASRLATARTMIQRVGKELEVWVMTATWADTGMKRTDGSKIKSVAIMAKGLDKAKETTIESCVKTAQELIRKLNQVARVEGFDMAHAGIVAALELLSEVPEYQSVKGTIRIEES